MSEVKELARETARRVGQITTHELGGVNRQALFGLNSSVGDSAVEIIESAIESATAELRRELEELRGKLRSAEKTIDDLNQAYIDESI